MSREFSFPLHPTNVEEVIDWYLERSEVKGQGVKKLKATEGLADRVFLWDLFEQIVTGWSPDSAVVIGEKTPDHALWALRLLASVDSFKVVGLIRDPREVYRSHLSVPWGIKDPWVFAEKWLTHARILDDVRRIYPDRSMIYNYEDLVRSPVAAKETAAEFLGTELTGRAISSSDIDGDQLVWPSEWWKRGAFQPVSEREPLWRELVDPRQIAIIEWRAADVMRGWGYVPESEDSLPPAVPAQLNVHTVRLSSGRADSTVLPVTENQLAAWHQSEYYRSKQWRSKAEELSEERNQLKNLLTIEQQRTLALANWRDHALEIGRVSAGLVERNRHLEADIKVIQQKSAEIQASASSWRSRAEYLNVEEKRLRTRILEEMVLRLELQKKERRAAGSLRRLRSRRWWKLAGALSRWRRAPLRVDRLIRELWRLAFTSEHLPPMPDTSKLDSRIVRLRNELESSRTEDEATMISAREALDSGDYEQSLGLLDSLPENVKRSKDVQLMYRDLYIRLGEVSRALASVRLALLSQEDQRLRSQARVLEGRLRETETHWLPSVDLKPTTEARNDTKSILHILKESLPYFERGYTIRSHTTMMAQIRAGFDPTVVTSLGFPRNQGFEDFPLKEVIDGVTHHRLDLGPSYETKEIPYDQILTDQATLTAQLARRIDPAVIQAGSGYRGYETALVGLAVARYLDVPMIYEIRSFLEHTWTPEFDRSEQGEYYRRRHDQETRCLLDSDQVITIAEAMRDEIVARGVPAEKVAVVPNVVDVERFRPRPKSEALIERIGLGRRPVLGYISNLGAREGIDNLVRSVRLLRDAGLDVAGLVVGDGPEQDSLRELISSLDLEDDFFLTGHVPNERIEDHYALIDLFVIPRIDDRAARLVTPLKPLEAMAMGIPVIASDLPALRELAQPGERGEVFAPADPEALANVAGDLLESPERRSKLAASAREWVLQERTLASNARRYEEILNQVLLTASHAR